MSSTSVSAHFDRYLGVGILAERVGEVELWQYSRPEFVSVATRGLAKLTLGQARPQELVCSVREGQEGAAFVVVRAAVQMLVMGNHGLVAGQIIPGGGALQGTQITGVIAAAHPYLGAGLTTIEGVDEEPPVEVITLVPLTPPEITLAHDSGADALFDALESADPPLLDVHRPPAVTPPAPRRGRRRRARQA